MKAKRFSAILFDLDGTLVDTTHLYADACITGMNAIGIPFTHEDFRHHYQGAMGMESWISAMGGDTTRLEEVRQCRDAHYHELLRTKSTFLPGAIDILRHLHGRTGVVTNSVRSYVDAIHECIRLYDHLPISITADEMGDFCKPYPHGVLTLLDRLGVPAEEALYVGDQIFDLETAHNAGVTSCLIHGPHTPSNAAEHADMVIEGLEELREIDQ